MHPIRHGGRPSILPEFFLAEFQLLEFGPEVCPGDGFGIAVFAPPAITLLAPAAAETVFASQDEGGEGAVWGLFGSESGSEGGRVARDGTEEGEMGDGTGAEHGGGFGAGMAHLTALWTQRYGGETRLEEVLTRHFRDVVAGTSAENGVEGEDVFADGESFRPV